MKGRAADAARSQHVARSNEEFCAKVDAARRCAAADTGRQDDRASARALGDIDWRELPSGTTRSFAKLRIVVEETNECGYWLDRIIEGQLLPEVGVRPLHAEAEEP